MMDLLRVAGDNAKHIQNIETAWKSFTGNHDVVLITEDGARIPISSSIIVLNSSFILELLKEIPQNGETFISVPIPCRILELALDILIQGSANVSNVEDVGQIREAAELLGISIGDLSSENRSRIKFRKSTTPLHIKKEVIDSHDLLVGAPPSTSSANMKKVNKTRVMPKVVRKIASQPKKIVIKKTKTKTVPAEMLLADELATVKVKQEPIDSNMCSVESNNTSSTFSPADKAKQPKVNKADLKAKIRFEAKGLHAVGKALNLKEETKSVVKITDDQGNLISLPKKAPRPPQVSVKGRKNVTEMNQVIRSKITSLKQLSAKKTETLKVPNPQEKPRNRTLKSISKHKILLPSKIKKEKVRIDSGSDVEVQYEEKEESQCPYCLKQFSNFKKVSAHMIKLHKNDV